ncbi:peptidase S8/S53 subtilisin kexin sedolisin [Actinoplanes sp. SE50/110]|uniref:type VII secretion-associated serine protease mycosin n=1 Tax=Actinoplanes sp. (strain ATCC 31044 / CBS 674.73 / SE50/110) TaxID=134676 RepID=UPI00023EE04A|nr:peptidase S8/S53 subtilisin kexin sedolisin [Actinoplanes sp. SE50/110]
MATPTRDQSERNHPAAAAAVSCTLRRCALLTVRHLGAAALAGFLVMTPAAAPAFAAVRPAVFAAPVPGGGSGAGSAISLTVSGRPAAARSLAASAVSARSAAVRSLAVPAISARSAAARSLAVPAVSRRAVTRRPLAEPGFADEVVEGRPLAEPGTAVEDTVRADEWQLQTLDLHDAWTYADGSGVTVAVIDSGVDAHHPDLDGQVLPGLDLVNPKDDGDTDPVGHGTTVSGIIAGRSDDNTGVVGIAPKAKILPVRVLDEANRYDDALIVAKGLRWAVDHGARVVNLSLGGSANSPALAAALDYAFAKDVVVVACTGNVSATSSAHSVWYPAREPGVLAVAGMERNGTDLWSGSITGPETVVTAPATELVGARPGGYWRVQGTSFAAPMVAGTAALIRSRWPDMSAGDVINRIIRTAKDRGTPGRDDVFGFGLIDPTGALTASVPSVLGNPLDTTPPVGVGRLGSAPASGEAQSAPTDDPSSQPLAAAPGTNAGGWAAKATAQPAPHRGRWIAISLFALSTAVGALTIRRFALTTG